MEQYIPQKIYKLIFDGISNYENRKNLERKLNIIGAHIHEYIPRFTKDQEMYFLTLRVSFTTFENKLKIVTNQNNLTILNLE